jgi:hypothetical protein
MRALLSEKEANITDLAGRGGEAEKSEAEGYLNLDFVIDFDSYAFGRLVPSGVIDDILNTENHMRGIVSEVDSCQPLYCFRSQDRYVRREMSWAWVNKERYDLGERWGDLDEEQLV